MARMPSALGLVEAPVWAARRKRKEENKCVMKSPWLSSRLGSCGFVLTAVGRGHLRIKVEQLFQPFGVVLEAAPDINALKNFVVRSCAREGRRACLGVIEISDGGRKMFFPRQQDVFGAARKVGLVLLCQRRDGKVFQPRVLE